MESFACPSTWMAAILSPDTLITSLSSGAEQFTGYSAQELVGRSITQILTDSSVFEMPHIMNAARECGYWEGEIILRARGGKLLEARCIMSTLASDGNCAAGYLLISNLSKSLILDEGDKSAVAQVVANLRSFAHDLNNSLAVLMGFAQLLILDANCQGNIRNDVEKLYSELKRVIQVVEKFHAYALSLYGLPKRDQVSGATLQQAPESKTCNLRYES